MAAGQVNPNHTWLNAAAQQDATDSVFAHYRQLIQLRHDRPILIDGDFAPLFEDEPHLCAYTRVSDIESLLIIANCGTGPSVSHGGRQLAWSWPRPGRPSSPETIDKHTVPLDSWYARIDHKPA